MGIALGEARCPAGFEVEGVDISLQATDEDVVDSVLLGLAELVRLGEADGVQLLEQAREAASMAVMWGRGEEQLVLEIRTDRAKHLGELAVLAEVGRHQVMRLVDDEQVPGQLHGGGGRVLGLASATKAGEDVGLAQVMV